MNGPSSPFSLSVGNLFRHFSIAAIFVLAVVPVGADELSETNKSIVADAAREFVPRCTFTVGESKSRLELQPEPILRWSNPTAGEVYGEVFVWTDGGRPAIVGSYYRWFSPDWGQTFEFTSCSDKPADATIEGRPFWNSLRPGITRKPLTDVEPPAKTAAARLVQMRRIASDFAVDLEDTRRDKSGVQRQLRLLSQPVYRNPTATEKSPYLDGALFAFVEGTDPELLLVLEATRSNDGSTWNFGLARMNRDALRVTFREDDVWSVPYIENVFGRVNEPYAIFSLATLLKDVEEGKREVKDQQR